MIQVTTIVAIWLFMSGTAKIQATISVIEPENMTHEKIDCAPRQRIHEYKNPNSPSATKGRIK